MIPGNCRGRYSSKDKAISPLCCELKDNEGMSVDRLGGHILQSAREEFGTNSS